MVPWGHSTWSIWAEGVVSGNLKPRCIGHNGHMTMFVLQFVLQSRCGGFGKLGVSFLSPHNKSPTIWGLGGLEERASGFSKQIACSHEEGGTQAWFLLSRFPD